MVQIKTSLEERQNYLLQLKKEKEKVLKGAPEGHLRICHSGNKTQYYKRSDPKDFNGVYINDKEIEVAYELAQKDYDSKVLRSIDKELKAIQRYMSAYPEKNAEQVYQSLHKARQKLIVPICETDEQFIARWENVKYQRKEFYDGTPEYFTSKGERVRSKSEVIIADSLDREGIPYRCEYPVYIKGIGKFYPDFMVLNVKERKEIIWDHFGMMDDAEYVEMFVRKITNYEKNDYFPGENLICTFETKSNPINQKIVMRMIERYLK